MTLLVPIIRDHIRVPTPIEEVVLCLHLHNCTKSLSSTHTCEDRPGRVGPIPYRHVIIIFYASNPGEFKLIIAIPALHLTWLLLDKHIIITPALAAGSTTSVCSVYLWHHIHRQIAHRHFPNINARVIPSQHCCILAVP